jgi:hypothetical protein
LFSTKINYTFATKDGNDYKTTKPETTIKPNHVEANFVKSDLEKTITLKLDTSIKPSLSYNPLKSVVEPSNLTTTTSNLEITTRPGLAESTVTNGASNYSLNNGVNGAYDDNSGNKLIRKTSLYDKVRINRII